MSAALNVFFVDEHTGAPVIGIVVGISGDDRPLATLQSGVAGYVSLKLDRATLSKVSRIIVSHGDAQLLAVDVADVVAGKDTYTVRVDPASAKLSPLGVPAVVDPSPRDLALAPAAIGFVPSHSNSLCAQLLPTTMTVRRFRAIQVRPDDLCNLETIGCGMGPDRKRLWEFTRGKVLEYEVAWYYAGTSLGDLVNTITLAPCERVNIAIADWTRRETASTTQAIDVRQETVQQMDHDRFIQETMDGTVKQKSRAWAVGGYVSAGGTIPKLDLDITAGFGGGFSSTSSSTNIALNTTNRLSEHIKQVATFVASQRSTVVFQATASEQHKYQTRCISNQNHCHTVTYVYYQVNANYSVVTDYLGERDVILVHYANVPFDARRAYCNARVLRGVLLDPALDSCFDELGDALFCCEEEAKSNALMESLTVFARVRAEFNTDQMFITLITATGSFQLPSIATSAWQPNMSYTVTVNLPAAIDPQQINSVLIHLTSSGTFGFPVLVLDELKLTFGQNGVLYSTQTAFQIARNWLTAVKAEVPPPPAGAENECVRKSCCIKKLIAHLNCNLRYYNRAVWMAEDPNDRVMEWSCCMRDGSPFSLIGEIVNEPITVYGDFVVFPAVNSQLVDDPTVLPVSELISMPTPGVYSEGLLGQCDTCEKVDPDSNWNWKDSPCPECPELPSPPEPQAGVKPSELKADAITNLITLTSVPTAPASVLKDLVSELVKLADAGSGQAQSLLEKLLTSIKEVMTGKKEEKK